MSILNKIINKKKEEVKYLADVNPTYLQQNNNDFLTSIISKKNAVIAELKSKSPSEGLIRSPYHPIEIAKAYERGGACAVSVLTDHTFFNGSFNDLKSVSCAIKLPTLCKDFIIDKRQIYQARLSGASACLLIVRILSDNQLIDLKNEIESLNMTALIEVYNQEDIKRALKVNPKLIGINNRNLDTLKMNKDNAKELRSSLPEGLTILSLSGAKSSEDIQNQLNQFDGVLVGTLLMRAKKPDMMIKSILMEMG
ncbi:indole-3-glycerol phosphate synthase TrpC [Thiotrichales bacterium 19S11-10]|nr:indole-3-glycerol phosphate synthase TrpC [Thiotrichales bacterium 19S11-10]